ncbi:DUF2267 domain-containing protein [Kitasatospora sp. NBC_00240]|uniref:DUF2267 domain-containing protein n=1 Tax=Kitasatospora sp. NBC_00240 TaxID=2903567 RepID=UPI002253959B|nr:DUF2267 domain-containing protein [Kitasatospora sp. NBC_00240]MCX5215320.1 DUF2267 domain-containing protein [Kitasatospora sp. NBC_00240]
MTRHDELINHVRSLGRYGDTQEAERVLTAVLTVLAGQLADDERRDLAAALPPEARALTTGQLPLTEPLTAPGFVDAVAARLATTVPTARWDVGAALTALADLTGPGLTQRLLAALPNGYALLFGRAQLVTAA